MPQGNYRGAYDPASRQFSIDTPASFQPFYEPDVTPLGSEAINPSPLFQNLPSQVSVAQDRSTVVSRKPRTIGQRFLYSRGGKRIRQFVMMATGRVQSSTFQPTTAHTWISTFNDQIFQAGYPGRNLGISEKVPSINPQALGTQAFQQQPAPRYTRSIFTNRSFSTPLPGKPAIPTNGQHS